MTRILLLCLCLLSFIPTCNAQIQQVEVKEKKSSKNQYKDFAYDGQKIWGLTTNGQIALFDANNGDPLAEEIKNDSPIVALANDREGNIVIGDKSKAIKKFDKQTHSWITLFKFNNTLLAITFDSKNNCYLITNKGIFDNLTKRYFYPDSSLHPVIRRGLGWIREPAFFIDKNDNIWIGFGYGEWGEELFVFNITHKKFIVPDLKGFPISLNPIKSIFESRENVFVTSGLMHFSTSGSIVKFADFKSNVIFESEDEKKFPNDSTNNEIIYGEYIGPGTYNEKDSCIYFYSQNGVFKGNPRSDLSHIENWKKVLQPKFHWTNGQPDAVGSPMNVLELKFIDSGKLIILSQNDGIGIFDGKTLIMTR